MRECYFLINTIILIHFRLQRYYKNCICAKKICLIQKFVVPLRLQRYKDFLKYANKIRKNLILLLKRVRLFVIVNE